MAKLFAIYGQPSDPAAFDRYYRFTHVPLAKTVPGLLSYEVSRNPVFGIEGKHATYLVAVLTFASIEEIQAALASPQGQATAADLANFATGGVDLLYADTELI